MTPDERDEIKRHFDVVGGGLRSEIRRVAVQVDAFLRRSRDIIRISGAAASGTPMRAVEIMMLAS